MKIKENAVEFKIDYLTLEVYPYDSRYNSLKFGVFQNDTEDITKFFCNNKIDGNIITDEDLGSVIYRCKEFTSIFMNNCKFVDEVSKQDIDIIICKELGTNHKISYVDTDTDGFAKYGYIEYVLHQDKVERNPFDLKMPRFKFPKLDLSEEVLKSNFVGMPPLNAFMHGYCTSVPRNNSENTEDNKES